MNYLEGLQRKIIETGLDRLFLMHPSACLAPASRPNMVYVSRDDPFSKKRTGHPACIQLFAGGLNHRPTNALNSPSGFKKNRWN
jgi:hypothetical protein